MYNNDLRQIIETAIDSFNQKESYLIINDLSERCICARFAMYITEAIKTTNYADYIVDVEYNRGANKNNRSIKRIDDTPIVADLIVHKRGYDCNCGFDNLICIEMKKSINRRGCVSDEERLKKMTGYYYGFCYQAGFMIIIDKKIGRLYIKNEFCGGQIV